MRRVRGSPGVSKPRKGARPRAKPDWREARRLFEVEGLQVAEIARRIGVKHHTVAAHRDGEGWDRQAVGNRAATAAAERLADEIVAATAPAIVDNVATRERCRKKALFVTERILDGLVELVQPGSDGNAPRLMFGLGSSPDLTLRRCFLNLGGSGDGEGSSGGAGDEDSAADEAAVEAALADLAGE